MWVNTSGKLLGLWNLAWTILEVAMNIRDERCAITAAISGNGILKAGKSIGPAYEGCKQRIYLFSEVACCNQAFIQYWWSRKIPCGGFCLSISWQILPDENLVMENLKFGPEACSCWSADSGEICNNELLAFAFLQILRHHQRLVIQLQDMPATFPYSRHL